MRQTKTETRRQNRGEVPTTIHKDLLAEHEVVVGILEASISGDLTEFPDLDPGDFTDQRYRLAFAVMQRLHEQGKDITLSAVAAAVKALREWPREIGPSSFVAGLVKGERTCPSPKTSADQVKRNAAARCLALAIRAVQEVVETTPAHELEGKLDTISADLEKSIRAIAGAPQEGDYEEDSGTPPFPHEVMGGWAKDLAEHFASSLESPVQFFYMAALTCLGNVLAGRIRLDSSADFYPSLP